MCEYSYSQKQLKHKKETILKYKKMMNQDLSRVSVKKSADLPVSGKLAKENRPVCIQTDRLASL